jgi:hypothetical protein
MISGLSVQAVLRTSAAVLAMVWMGHAAVAQDTVVEDPVSEEYVDGLGDPAESTEEPVFYVEDGVLPEDGHVTIDLVWDDEVPPDEGDVDGGGDDGLPTDEEIVDDEGYVEEEILLSDGIGDGLPLDGEGEPVAEGSGEEEPVFVTSCGGCELETSVGGPEVQRDNATGGVIVDGSDDGDDAVARSGSNACDSGAISKMWICTVQNGAWRD